MVYIRIKKISNNHYAYLVENKNTSSGPRQKVKQYLGKVHYFEKKEVVQVPTDFKNNNDLILNLIKSHLLSLGFKENKSSLSHKNISFLTDDFKLHLKTKSNSVKNAVLKLNDGYLSTFTIKRIIDFKKSEDFDKDANLLASYFLEAGLEISQENFVKFYQLL